MKITVNGAVSEPKLVAVVGENGTGMFLPGYAGANTTYVTESGTVQTGESNTLAQVLAKNNKRTPIYEGDTVTLQF